MATENFDVLVLGAGPGGEVVAWRLLGTGRRVALVERELIGGECAYWACVPTKTLLRPVELLGETGRGFGITGTQPDWPGLSAYRDYMIRELDDSRQVKQYRDQGVTVVKAEATFLEPGLVEAGGRLLRADQVVVATGSEPIIPEVEGLVAAGYWTNREPVTAKRLPESVVCLGGGPVSLEIGQFLARFGCRVTILERGGRLLGREDRPLAEALAAALSQDGVQVLTSAEAVRVSRTAAGEKLVELADGRQVQAQELMVATGRRPRTRRLNLQAYGLDAAHGLRIDDTGRVLDPDARVLPGLWAVGDVTGVSLFTHVAKYQGRVVAAGLKGRARRLDYRAVPRVIFTDPPVASVGLGEEAAREEGKRVKAVQVSLAEISRSHTFQREPGGFLRLVVSDEGVICGVQAVGPLAAEWIHVGALAVKMEMTPAALEDLVFQYPTFGEAYTLAAESYED
jgi:dihydrolipoamide dehydrogenase